MESEISESVDGPKFKNRDREHMKRGTYEQETRGRELNHIIPQAGHHTNKYQKNISTNGEVINE